MFSATHISRRHFVKSGFSASLALAGLSTFSSAQAVEIRSDEAEMLGIDQKSRGALLIDHTFARHCQRTPYRPILERSQHISETYTKVTRDMRASGFNINDVHGYPIGNDGLIAIDGGDSLGVASVLDEGCITTVLPEELGAFLSMHDEHLGLPSYFSRNGRQFTSEAALRYATPHATVWRRDLCARSSSRFVGFGQNEADRCKIEVTPKFGTDGRSQGNAKVVIETPKGTLEHPNLPTDPSAIPTNKSDKISLGGDWKFIG